MMNDKFKTALLEIAFAGKYYTPEQMIEIAKCALRSEPRDDKMNVCQIKERLQTGLFQTLETTEQDLFDIQFLIIRIEEVIRVNRGLTQDFVESEVKVKKLEEAMSNIAFGYVDGDYADVRQYARERLTDQ